MEIIAEETVTLSIGQYALHTLFMFNDSFSAADIMGHSSLNAEDRDKITEYQEALKGSGIQPSSRNIILVRNAIESSNLTPPDGYRWPSPIEAKELSDKFNYGIFLFREGLWQLKETEPILTKVDKYGILRGKVILFSL